MTPKRKAELRELSRSATPGPWACWNAYDIPGTDRVGFSRIGTNDGGGVESPAHSSTDIQCRKADVAYIVAACNAIPELLDELEALTTKLDEYRKQFAEDQARINNLATQVAMLRKAAEGVRVEHVAPMVTRLRGTKRMQEVLADTEAAATAWLEAHDREQQLAGAERACTLASSFLADHLTTSKGPSLGSALAAIRSVREAIGLEAMQHEASHAS